MREHARNVLDLTSNLIKRFGPRPAGSDSSRGCADAFRAEAESISDNSRTEDFQVHPEAFLGWIRILVFLYALAVVGLWMGFYLVSTFLIASGLFILVFQFFLYRELLDPFFPKRTGRNVLASIEPTEDLRGELIISGHHDSARIFNFMVHQPALYPFRVIGSLSSLALLGLTSGVMVILKSMSGGTLNWSRIPSIVFSLLFILVVQLWWFASSKHTDGAGDNLASSAAAWELLRIFSKRKKAGEGFRHLRITAASWDAEEAGLRGARAWRKGRSGKGHSHKAWNLNLESMYDEKDFFLLTSDINGSVKLSTELTGRCQRLLKSGSDLSVDRHPMPFLSGGTDAGEIARAGVQSTTLVGLHRNYNEKTAVLHTPADVVDAVSETAVLISLRLAVDLADELDGELSAS